MQESYSEVLVSYAVPEWYAGSGNTLCVAMTGVHAGKLLSSEIITSVCRRRPDVWKARSLESSLARFTWTRRSQRTGNSKRENRESPGASQESFFDLWERSESGSDGTADMHATRGSYKSVVPTKLANNDGKTRLIEFGRCAAERRPETFDFLGFTHQCGMTRRHGWFTVHRKSIAKRMRSKLADLKQELRKRRHDSIGETGRWIGRVVQSWMNDHAVPGIMVRLQQFVDGIAKLWLRQLWRCSQRSTWTWRPMHLLARKHLPRSHIIHPYPDQRFRARLAAGAVWGNASRTDLCGGGQHWPPLPRLPNW